MIHVYRRNKKFAIIPTKKNKINKLKIANKRREIRIIS